MRTIVSLILSIILVIIIISPFLLLKLFGERRKWWQIILAMVISIGLFIFTQIWLYNFILKKYINSYDALGYFDDIDFIYSIAIVILFINFPFIFTKILYGKISLKSFFISLLFSVIIFVTLFLIFAYYIFPMAGSVLLHNI